MTHAILTCSEHFTDLALNELQREHPQLSVLQQLTPQHILLHLPGTFDTLTRPWRHRLLVYLHHLFPVHDDVSLTGNRSDLKRLQRVARRLASQGSQPQIRIVDGSGLYYDAAAVHRRLQSVCSSSANKSAGRILSVLIVGTTAYIGMSWASQNLSPWAGGEFPFQEIVPNRAGYKLIEALNAFDIRLQPNIHALDLGAAPGAWTTVLRRRGVRVTAVAPAEKFYRWLGGDSAVNIVRMKAEDYLPACDTHFDLITNDMMVDGQDSARIMVNFASRLRIDGFALMTLKLRDHSQRRVMDHTLRLLRRAYKIVRIRQLVSNRHEVTLFLRRKE